MDIFKEKDNTDFQKAIVRTVAYFDMFDFPLTDFEIWKFLSKKSDYVDVRNVLSGLASLETKNGFYFLKGREEIIRTRLDRYNFTDRKMKRALRVAKIYRAFPWVKMVAVSNVIGAHNLKDGSDIDIFIVAEKNRIWLTRFFCAGLAKALGLRPSEKNSRDKICLNFYLSEEDMNLEKFMLNYNLSFPRKRESRNMETGKMADIYFIYWLANLIAIYDKNDTYKKFIQANQWLKNYLPNWQPSEMVGRRFVEEKSPHPTLPFARGGNNTPLLAKEGPACRTGRVGEGFFENIIKKIQLRKLPVGLKEIMNKDTRVVINDSVLKLHAKDRRGEYRKKWEEKTKDL